MNRPRLFALDDDPGRYDGLRLIVGDRVELVVGCCPACVAAHLPRADAVLLDHDLDGWPCVCGTAHGLADSRGYLPAIVASGPPVIVTSGSASENRRHLTTELLSAGARVTLHSAHEIMPEWVWIGRLWAWGVL